ncbi:hypothetical protein CR513_02121, partial [Mucuna pruriens]
MLIIVDEHSFRLVEGKEFKHFRRQLLPQFTISYKGIQNLRIVFNYILINAFFRSNCNRIALTTYRWKFIQNVNYLNLTTQRDIKKVEKVLGEWELRNVSTIMVDVASFNYVVVEYIKRRMKNINEFVIDREFLHMRYTHIMNLVVNDGLKDIHNSITII